VRFFLPGELSLSLSDRCLHRVVTSIFDLFSILACTKAIKAGSSDLFKALIQVLMQGLLAVTVVTNDFWKTAEVLVGCDAAGLAPFDLN
jgi:hypothetical protein